MQIEAGISTAFGCALQGAVPEDEVIRLAAACVAAGADEAGLSDTTGMANPAQVRRLFRRLRSELGERAGSAHMHNTRGLGLANCLAAWDVGVRSFDGSLGGLGGCPHAPGASGNVVTEDLVFMFEAMGVSTGVNLEKLIAAREPLQAGRPGDPLRAGTSVNDIMGGMFDAIGAMAALAQRDHPTRGTGLGQEVQSALFENNVFLVAQHMMQFAVTGQPAAPMPARISAWAVYDVFQVKGGEQIFLAVVSDTAWALFCNAFGFADLKQDPRLASNNGRVRARDWMMPVLRERLAGHSAAELAAVFERHGLPFAPITRPQDLLDDPHLQASGGLAPITLPDGRETRTVLPPLTLGGERPGVRLSPPRLGEHSAELLAELGYGPAEIEQLLAQELVSQV